MAPTAGTRPDRYGLPRLRLPRTKQVKGFATGDLVQANVPGGKKAGVHTGRVAVRTTGSFNITARHGTVRAFTTVTSVSSRGQTATPTTHKEKLMSPHARATGVTCWDQ